MGRTWRQTGRFPMCHARPFTVGGRLYILGHRGNLGVCVSTDKGETWSEVGWLTKGQSWHQSACNVWYARGNVYLVMERMVPSPDGRKFGWGVNRLVPVLMRAKETDDLTQRGSWTFAESFHFDSIFGGQSGPRDRRRRHPLVYGLHEVECRESTSEVIVSRSGDKNAMSPHNGDMITFHRVTDFRSLVY